MLRNEYKQAKYGKQAKQNMAYKQYVSIKHYTTNIWMFFSYLIIETLKLE